MIDTFRQELEELFEAPRSRSKKAAQRRPAKRLSELLQGRLPLRREYKGRVYRATVRPDGTIRYGRRVYASPTSAAKEIVRGRVNGWQFWQFERSPGEWVRLSELGRGGVTRSRKSAGSRRR
ncbi:MAG: DUF2924 domain-containing protein [Gemmatimonadetes bacterium]|nr:DUF2924 domain-containing protein [Gemmatimonadota bacterium]